VALTLLAYAVLDDRDGNGTSCMDTAIGDYYNRRFIQFPPGVAHCFKALGNENLLVLVVFAPPLTKKDKTFV
jgi:mannose-6-phosphate isomerase-like protein (cupin superfamily)